MNRAHKILSVLLLGSYGLGIQLLDAQTVSGRITDRESSPVTGAAVVLQTPDSIFVSAAVSDADGHFTLSAQPEQYRLIVQHLLYRSRTVNGTGKDVGTIVLQPADRTIGEVVIKAERPIVRVEEGRLNYDLEQIVRDKVVNNTYEALQRLPGVQEIGGKLTLSGAGDVTVILNGKPTTMDAGQLETLLRNTPVSRVEKVEVMYSTPPQYHVRGASLNIVLKRPNDYSFQGEVNASYDNCYFNAGNATGNFRFSTPKLALDAMYGIDRVHTMQYYNLFSRHTLDGQVYSIEENEQLRNKAYRHNMRVAGECHFDENSSIDLAYTGKYMPNIQDRKFPNQRHRRPSRSPDAQHRIAPPFGIRSGCRWGLYALYDRQPEVDARRVCRRQPEPFHLGWRATDRPLQRVCRPETQTVPRMESGIWRLLYPNP